MGRTRTVVREALANGVVLVLTVATVLAIAAFLMSFLLRDDELRDDFEPPSSEAVTA